MNDGHFHLTNYIQEGTDIREFLEIMGTRVWRTALFGIPLQQQWSYRVSGDAAPAYYLDTDADLYYYSFTDAVIAIAYESLSEEEQARFDPMITGFNPADMYAADHIRRVLQTFPGVFSGIGEFTIHKEFVSSKIAGDVASLSDPALDRILDFAGEVGLVVILHSDIHMPFAKLDKSRVYFEQTKQLFARHPGTTIIWAHAGLGRVIQPVGGHIALLREILADPALAHVRFDISWTEMAKYVVDSPEAVAMTAAMIEINSVEIARRVFASVDAAELSGTLIVLPAINSLGFRMMNRYMPDRRDLNRSFPGDPDGSVATIVADAAFSGVIRNCTHLVDLHTGSNFRTNLPQIRVDTSDPVALEMAYRFGVGVIVAGAGPSGSLRREAMKIGIPSIIYEAGPPFVFVEAEIERGAHGVQNLMNHLAMVSAKAPAERAQMLGKSAWPLRRVGGGASTYPSSSSVMA